MQRALCVPLRCDERVQGHLTLFAAGHLKGCGQRRLKATHDRTRATCIYQLRVSLIIK